VGYFDGLTDAAFKTDAEGRVLFFPWGVLGRGYVLPDQDAHQRLRGQMRTLYIVGMPLMILLVVIGQPMILASLLPVMLVAQLAMVRVWTRGLEPASESMTMGEAYRNSANSHGAPTLWVLLVCSVLLTFGAVFIVVAGEVLAGGVATAFFLSASGLFAYMIGSRKSTNGCG
jgi:hypothetical protein